MIYIFSLKFIYWYTLSPKSQKNDSRIVESVFVFQCYIRQCHRFEDALVSVCMCANVWVSKTLSVNIICHLSQVFFDVSSFHSVSKRNYTICKCIEPHLLNHQSVFLHWMLSLCYYTIKQYLETNMNSMGVILFVICIFISTKKKKDDCSAHFETTHKHIHTYIFIYINIYLNKYQHTYIL